MKGKPRMQTAAQQTVTSCVLAASVTNGVFVLISRLKALRHHGRLPCVCVCVCVFWYVLHSPVQATSKAHPRFLC